MFSAAIILAICGACLGRPRDVQDVGVNVLADKMAQHLQGLQGVDAVADKLAQHLQGPLDAVAAHRPAPGVLDNQLETFLKNFWMTHAADFLNIFQGAGGNLITTMDKRDICLLQLRVVCFKVQSALDAVAAHRPAPGVLDNQLETFLKNFWMTHAKDFFSSLLGGMGGLGGNLITTMDKRSPLDAVAAHRPAPGVLDASALETFLKNFWMTHASDFFSSLLGGNQIITKRSAVLQNGLNALTDKLAQHLQGSTVPVAAHRPAPGVQDTSALESFLFNFWLTHGADFFNGLFQNAAGSLITTMD